MSVLLIAKHSDEFLVKKNINSFFGSWKSMSRNKLLEENDAN